MHTDGVIDMDDPVNIRTLVEGLQAAFSLELTADKRVAAETAYALAFCYRNNDVCGVRRFDLAKAWAVVSIELLDALSSAAVDEVVSTRSSVGGVPLPELLHSDVVRQRLSDVLT